MASDVLEVEGTVVSVSRGDITTVAVELGSRRVHVIARRAGRLVKNWIRVVPGDRVTVEVSPYDTTRGRITHRIDPGRERTGT